MVKVVCVVDKVGTALDRLAKGMAPYHKNIEYHVVDVHPKRPDPSQLAEFEKHLDADIFDFQYFRTAQLLMKMYDLKGKKILTHNNPYSIHESNWEDFDFVVANNLSIEKELVTITTKPVEYIPLTVDTDFWQFNPDWKPNNKVLMVANRIESKKGVKEVAQACKKAGAEFHLVGAISDAEYFREVLQSTEVHFYQQITDDELRKLYHSCSLHICNSVDNFESGTLPILEAMLCGTPVLTRNVGHVPDLYNGENLVLNENPTNDVDSLADLIKSTLEDANKLQDLREKAWQTAKNRSHERRAYSYQGLYRKVLFDQRPVTIIMPVSDKPEITEESVKAIEDQTYKNIELIMINDGELPQPTANVPFFRYMENYGSDYGLARARNKGIVESTGEIIIFCDQRIVMEPNAVEEFVNHLAPRIWLYGSKGVKKEFVENFSAIHRDEIVRMGMFNERINLYGGMSQEIRVRARYQGIKTEYLDSARAKQIGKSSNKHRRKQEIIRMKNMLWKMGLEQ